MRRDRSARPGLVDCREAGAGRDSELFIVEGDSAAGNVARVRDERTQAVLPMQGKPMNADKAARSRIEANPWFAALIAALDCGIGAECDLRALRYRRVLLLFDPDADGIHCGALMLIFFARLMPAMLDAGRIWMVRAPLLRLSAPSLPAPRYACSLSGYRQLLAELTDAGITDIQTLRYRGLGSLEDRLLRDACVARDSRRAQRMDAQDAAMALQYFGARSG